MALISHLVQKSPSSHQAWLEVALQPMLNHIVMKKQLKTLLWGYILVNLVKGRIRRPHRIAKAALEGRIEGRIRLMRPLAVPGQYFRRKTYTGVDPKHEVL